jgi:hypothetical protein
VGILNASVTVSCEFESRSWRSVLDTTLCDSWIYTDVVSSNLNQGELYNIM